MQDYLVYQSVGLNKFIPIGINVLDSRFRGNDRENLGNDRENLGNDREDLGNDREDLGNDRENRGNDYSVSWDSLSSLISSTAYFCRSTKALAVS